MSGARHAGDPVDGGPLDIRAGGLIAVDTGALRHVAGILSRLSSECADLSSRLRLAGVLSRDAGLWDPDPAGRAEAAQDRATELARALRHRADVYELVEQHATRAVSGIEAGSGAAAREAERMWEDWRAHRHAEVGRQLAGAVGPFWQAGLLFGTMGGLVRSVDRGTILCGDPVLRPATRPAVVTELSRTRVRAPRSLAEIVARIPGDADGRVRVETYTTASGRREHVVYITGTRDLGTPYAEPWDMASNIELYLGQASSSYDATGRALEAAGALAGDRVHLVGHSQGAMIATRFAREGGYEVASLITFASPVQAELPDDVLSVAVRHTDDPIVALSAGGVPVPSGSRDSFVVERVADPQPRLGDLALGVHHLDAYRETAALVDASDDPRVDALRAHLAGLASAGTATAVVYGARRDVGADPTVGRSRGASPAGRSVSGAWSAGGG